MARLSSLKNVATLAIGSLFLSLLPISLAQATIKGCLPDIGKQLPLIMVHGFMVIKDPWLSMQNALVSIEGSSTVTFDYKSSSTHWVDDQNIGPKLAERIACIAQSSREAGGPGKVVVVGHSMGGLAARFAANYTLSNGHHVADDLGLVVTIGTPHLGSELADIGAPVLEAVCLRITANQPWLDQKQVEDNLNKCRTRAGYLSALDGLRPDSARLKSLKPFPASIPVQAIAGNVGHLSINIFEKQLNFGDSDKVVDVKSATQESAHKEAGGGISIIQCVGVNPIMSLGSLLKSDANCEHSNLVNNRQVQDRVIDSIRQYRRYLENINSPTRWFAFGRLEIPLSKGWKVKEPSSDNPKITLTNTLSHCMGRDYGCQILALIHPSAGDGDWVAYPICYKDGATMNEWGEYAGHPLVYKNLFPIGNHKAAYYQQDFCFDYHLGTTHFWILPKSDIGIFTTASGAELAAIKSMLAQARWK